MQRLPRNDGNGLLTALMPKGAEWLPQTLYRLARSQGWIGRDDSAIAGHDHFEG